MHNLEKKGLFFPLTQLIHFLTFVLVISRKERERERVLSLPGGKWSGWCWVWSVWCERRSRRSRVSWTVLSPHGCRWKLHHGTEAEPTKLQTPVSPSTRSGSTQEATAESAQWGWGRSKWSSRQATAHRLLSLCSPLPPPMRTFN